MSDLSFPKVFLLRHGQTEWNVAGRLQGRFDSDLTEKGRAQAVRQGEILAALGAEIKSASILCSPLGRAQQTARIAFDPLGVGFETDARLREISAGSWDGVTLTEIEQTHGPLFEQARNAFELMFLAPDGEGEMSVLARCKSLLAELSGPSVLITHGATLCVLRGLLRELPFEETLDLDHEQGCVYLLENGLENILR